MTAFWIGVATAAWLAALGAPPLRYGLVAPVFFIAAVGWLQAREKT